MQNFEFSVSGNLSVSGNVSLNGTSGNAGQILTSQGPNQPAIWQDISGTGSVTSVAATGSTDISVTGSPITTAGTLSFSLLNTSVVPGTYGSSTKVPVFTVDSKGRLTSSSEVSIPTVSAPNSQILYGTGSSVTSSTALTFTESTNTLGLGGSGAASISSDVGYPMLISGDTYITFSTAGQNRLSILQTGEITLNSVSGTAGQVLTSQGAGQPPAWQNPSASGGTVTNVSALTIGTIGSDITSTVATSTTTPVITLNIPTASATNRGVLSAADWVTFNSKGNGTVTSVSVSSGTTGLTVSGSPITSSGTITIGGTLSIANGGTGATNSTAALTNLLPTQTGNTGKVLTTDGTSVSWATASGSGGLGVGQTWQSVSRSSGVTYYNTTGKPISIAIGNNGGGSFNSVMYISIDGGSYFPFGGGMQPNGGAYVWGGTVIVPAGASYNVSASSITYWYELR